MKSLKKLCVIMTIISMSLINSQLKAAQGIDSSNMYFYGNMSYEGFAGYLTVITPEITEASNAMKKKLNINDVNNKHVVQTTTFQNHNKATSTHTRKDKNSSSNQFSTIAISQANKLTQTKDNALASEFQDIVISL